jgi:hypothetical protein
MNIGNFTHNAYTLKREGPRSRGSMIKIGTAIISSPPDGVHFIRIESLPVGGFNGNIHLHPVEEKVTEAESER